MGFTSGFSASIAMRLSALILLVCVVANINGDAATNTFLDSLLNNIKPLIRSHFDPIPLPNLHHSFSQKIFFVDVRGDAWLSQGKMWGLKNIRRVGNTDMKQSGANIEVKGRAGISGVKGQYRVKATFMNLGVTVTAHVWVNNIRVKIAVRQALKSGAHPDLRVFAIEQVNGIGVRIDGLGPLGWIVGGLTQLIGNHLKGPISNALNAPIKNLIR